MRQINNLFRVLSLLSITTLHWSDRAISAVDKVCRSVKFCLSWLVDAIAAPVTQVFHREAWQETERAFSAKVNHQLNIFGRPAKSTGALCSPLLS